MLKRISLSLILITLSITGISQKNKQEESDLSKVASGLKFRAIGPALTAGRIADIAVNPNDHDEYYLAVASGGVWKTSNAGTTFEPIFDGENSYSVGCITIDPSNPNIIWVGSGENNNQRSVAYGDGVYKSEDGGRSWKHMGLKNSEHIHKIIVHPENSDIVYVASNGPLWREGGDRGIYKSYNGGETWEEVINVGVHTGFCDLVMDPRDPDVLYAAAHQRRRHVWTYIGGGPESGLYKSTDGGKNWTEINKGLPSVDLGRIGLAISPANPDVVYAIVEAAQGEGGFFRSDDRGAYWNKMSNYSTSGNYYQEIICDPYELDKIFSMNTWLHHSEDGGKSFKQTGEAQKHVDNHCMWIDPNDTDHWRVGCDGGLYETWDHAKTWQYKANLPITQFYKVAVDNDQPFYNVYGGTQDNNSLGGPSRTINNAGILNSDWYITNGGDGFESQVDPKNPDIVYAQAQYGWLVRYDRKSGERVSIKPQPKADEPAFRWNWDAPLLISPHNHKRLYFAANKLFRSDDRGNSWKAVSGDLTRQLDRNKIPVMGRVWSIDAVRKNLSTTIYGNIVALDESPQQENLIYVGTDDGLIQVSEDAENWRKISEFPGVPERTYVNMILASQHDAGTVYAVFNNHKNGDFKPYVLKSTDKGKSWKSIVSNLPERGSVYAIAEDHVDPDLLFVGTEFGVFTTKNGGESWVQLKSGLPTIAVRDIAIQKRENDLVLGTFGRSFYVLDDYTPLRYAEDSVLAKDAHIFPVKTALMYNETNPLGLSGVGSQGASMYAAENPPVGAVFTFYMKEGIKTRQEKRRQKEKEIKKEGGDVFYPSMEELRAEEYEEEPYLVFLVKDAEGEPVKKIKTNASGGTKRVVWNFRHATTTPVRLEEHNPGRYGMKDDGYLALPGKYMVEVYSVIDGEPSLLVDPVSFETKLLKNKTLPAQNRKEVDQFYSDLSELRRSIQGASKQLRETQDKVKYFKAAVTDVPEVPMSLMKRVKNLDEELRSISIQMWGDNVLSKHQWETPPSITGRIEGIVYGIWESSSEPTQTNRESYNIARKQFEAVHKNLVAAILEAQSIEKALDKHGAPYTPGRSEDWKKE